MKFELKDKIYLNGITTDTYHAIRQLLTIENPAYAEAEKMGRWTGDMEQHLHFYEAIPNGLACPRGAARKLYNECCAYHGENVTIVDNRRTLDPVNFTFQGELRPLQADAVKGFTRQDMGLLQSPTGAGKTVMALSLIADRKQPALIVVHTKELLNQWVDRIGTFLGIQADEVGIIGNGKFQIGDHITVAMVQTLHKRADEVVPHIGHLILDECHRAPAMQYVKAIEQFDCKYILGLTATPYRRDGLGQVIQWHIGPIAGRINKDALVHAGSLVQAEAVFIPTGHISHTDPAEYYSKALSELTGDLDRNMQIAETVHKHNGHGITLILSDRREHCETIGDLLHHRHGIKAAVLTGQTPARVRQEIIRQLQSGRCDYLVATGQLIGEGFDLPGISTLVLATPVKFSGRLVQYVGRALRPAPGKGKALILDLVDDHGVFQAAARSREQVYKQQGIRVNAALQEGAA
jgi:superfamily II DNA or RNA helicase